MLSNMGSQDLTWAEEVLRKVFRENGTFNQHLKNKELPRQIGEGKRLQVEQRPCGGRKQELQEGPKKSRLAGIGLIRTYWTYQWLSNPALEETGLLGSGHSRWIT